MGIPKDLLEILACAFCKSPVEVKGDRIHCTEARCGLTYPIQDDSIPVMLIDEADRPCPSCGTQRNAEEDNLVCPKCGESFRYERRTDTKSPGGKS